jgi:hypothetical protein
MTEDITMPFSVGHPSKFILVHLRTKVLRNDVFIPYSNTEEDEYLTRRFLDTPTGRDK